MARRAHPPKQQALFARVDHYFCRCHLAARITAIEGLVTDITATGARARQSLGSNPIN
jgi:hypothetical protein